MSTAAACWQIWIDTGGTFTDCLALAPDGRWHRAKVLSSGALRGRVLRAVSPRQLQLKQSWGGAVRGGQLRLLGARGPAATIMSSKATGLLELDRSLEASPGDLVEVGCAEPAPLLAARLVTGTPAGAGLPPHRMRLATTLGTNALLQRRGAAVALFITCGFGDLLQIGTQQRPDLFALQISRPAPLPQAVVEVPERVAADGAVLRPLELEQVEREGLRLLQRGIRSAAVSLVNSYRNPQHEQILGRSLRRLGFDHVSCSAELAPVISMLPRTETAVVNAYLAPLLGQFLEHIDAARGGEPLLECEPSARNKDRRGASDPLLVMTSAGGLVRVRTAREAGSLTWSAGRSRGRDSASPSVQDGAFAPKDSLLSGPAAGVVGAARAGAEAGFSHVISFDMGGTSTDVARFDGDYDYSFEQRVGDVHLSTVAMAIETVAAGGGSICSVDELGVLHVGPHSAGADPGPACYGAGGPLTLTDVNLLLGRLDPSRFRIPIDPARAQRALEEVRGALERPPGARGAPLECGPSVPDELDGDALLEGLLELANERMADAIRRVSVRKGYDPKDYALVAFGGAGPQHACGVAARLGVCTVVVPPDAGLLSACGVGHATVERVATRQVLRPLEQVRPQLEDWLDQLAAEACRLLQAPAEETRVRRRLANLRLVGQDTPVTVDLEPGRDPAALFSERFEALYGYRPGDRPVELESLRVVVGGAEPAYPTRADVAAAGPSGTTLRARFDGRWCDVVCHARAALQQGQALEGPAVVMDLHSTTVVEYGWRATLEGGALILRRPAASGPALAASAGPVELELFVGRLTAIVTEMGELLRRTALSTNIKERQDFSCALLDADGELVVNAPHIPVHLGSLGLCVRCLAAVLPMAPGDVVVTNHPAHGGSHLPDITVVTPIHDSGQLVGYVANRAHHAEIGGTRPGSMPPDARTLAQEGVVIPPTLLVAAGQPRWETIERLLRQPPYPSRAVADNLADLAAQVAANHLGATALARLAADSGRTAVQRQMAALKQRTAQQIGQALAAIPDGEYRARDTLDDGTPLAVRVAIAGRRATIDFEGCGPTHPGNLNATPAVVRGVAVYVLRLLVRQALPLNEGLMRAVELRIPRGLLDPEFADDPALAPAVVGGNVETSQRLVDLLLQALQLAACSQGTMNNVVFGNQRFGYYETVGGGAGAGPGFPGASGVHTHMTNTRITDVEVLEQRFPVRMDRFALRRGSGGAGRFRGGDGLVRELTFLERVELSLLSQRRTTRPCGLAGGQPGLSGAQHLVRADGTEVQLGAIAGCVVEPGDRLVLRTPGGGGYGAE